MNAEGSTIRVVGIGASAGGMDALKEFFAEMPSASGLAFVVIQHLDPAHVSYMAGLLAKCTAMNVVQAEDRIPVEADCVYTIPPGKFLLIRDGILRLTEAVKRDGLRMPIDFFFRSLAQDQGENAIAVLFSGSGSDGTLGIREVRGAGGVVFVQDPKTAQFDSMIESAIATQAVDYVLPVREIPGAILQYVQRTGTEPASRPETITQEGHTGAILDLLVSETKADFRCYRKGTIQRRIQRRMGLNGVQDISDYYRLLCENPGELARLSKDMLIGVTSFFRDPEAFEELHEKVITVLVQEKSSNNLLRAWIPGCATGEEAYSIVILLMEEMARARKTFSLQIFASDLDREALKYAREGIYPESITADLSEERLARFFVKKDGTYQIAKQAREVVTFAEHNVIFNPPFLKMDLISCRNLLIYIEPEIQKKVLNLLAFALNPGGYLFLGKSDTAVEQSDLFEPVSRSARIYRRKPSIAVPFVNLPLRSGAPLRPARAEDQHPIKLSDLNQQVLLKHFNASIVLVNENGGIMHFYGPSHKYLAHPYGDANLNLFEMIEKTHSSMLRLAVEKAARENQPVSLQALELSREDASQSVNVTVMPVIEPKSGKRLLAVIFEDARPPDEASPASARETESRDSDLIARLEAENKSLKQEIQATIDGFQTTHEELMAANEEVMAINEELQSTNEELETSKEELQSVNEELVTVNNQLSEKVEEINKINDDLANFLNSSEVVTLFLDRRFCIRRFTPSATKLMNLISLDVGRPVSHISNELIDVDLISIADNVLKNLAPFEREVRSSDGLWYILRCIPYRTLSNVIDGVVFTFTEVSRLKHSEEAMTEARDYAENIIHTIRESLLVLNPELKVVSANRAFFKTFQVSPEETQGRSVYELGNHQWDIPGLRALLEEVLHRDGHFENFEVEHVFPAIGPRIMSLNARRISHKENHDVRLILIAIDDVTERRRAEAERKKLEEQLVQAQKMESIGTLAAGIAHDFNNILNIIQGYASVLTGDGAKNEEIAESVNAITDATRRGAAIVQQLLTIARKTQAKFEPTDVNTLLDKLSHLLRETFPKNIEVVGQLNRDLPPIMADSNQITQVLLNISLNARDAMPNGGRLTFKTEAADGKSLQADGAAAERYVCIEIKDTGIGMSEEIQSRIFEPFFTTKPIGQGSGLGLAVAYGIAKNHGGLIQVESEPVHGTTVRIYLPAASSGSSRDVAAHQARFTEGKAKRPLPRDRP
ncbi:MAG: PAS domain-containing protein [Deltaproteobacteria bacterium]|nr:PAS domain-containing protein [Deltaproteobacteria bacterium]